MIATGFEPVIPAIKQLQTSAIDLTATGIGCCILGGHKFTSPKCSICLVFCSSDFILVSLLSNTCYMPCPSQTVRNRCPCSRLQDVWGRRRRYPLILNLGEWSNSRPGHFTWGGEEPWNPLNRRWVGPRVNPDALPLSRFETRTFQPTLRYTDSIALERRQTLQCRDNLPYGRSVVFPIIPTQTQTQTKVSYSTYTIALHISFLNSTPLS